MGVAVAIKGMHGVYQWVACSLGDKELCWIELPNGRVVAIHKANVREVGDGT